MLDYNDREPTRDLLITIIIIIIIIIIRKFITRTCSQALSLNRRRGRSLGGLTVCIVYELGYKVGL